MRDMVWIHFSDVRQAQNLGASNGIWVCGKWAGTGIPKWTVRKTMVGEL
jgi:hypothetical protein